MLIKLGNSCSSLFVVLFMCIINPEAKTVTCDTTNWGKDTTIECVENNCPHDSTIFFYRPDSTISKTTFLNCGVDAIFVLLSSHADTLSFAYLKRGKTIGAFRQWYSKGKKQAVVNYNDSGQKHGLSEAWYENGNRKDSIVYVNGDIAEAREYYLDGRLRYWDIYHGEKTQEGYRMTPGGKPCGRIVSGNGTIITYASDGTNRYLEEYVNGVQVTSRKLKPGENPKLK